MSSKELPARLKESIEASKCEYRNLGKSGLRISVPVFGCMSFGDKRTLPWVIGEDEVRCSVLRRDEFANILPTGPGAPQSCL
jgi:hypothetical protein